ncbi:MAG: hypothetical protein D6776_01225 [Planctomycetota bacterium]|nr:MAG: hypothetical protein D6776_01225 [Planctomycetota bacterium]
MSSDGEGAIVRRRVGTSWRRWALGLGVVALGCLALQPEGLAQHRRRGRRGKRLKLAFIVPENTTWARIMERFDRELQERTGGRLGFRLYLGGVQGDEKVVLRKIRAGQLDGGGFSAMGIGEIVPEVRLLEVPFQIRDYEEADLVRAQIDAHIRARLHDRGYELLSWFELGFVYLFSKRPLRTVEDVRRAKPWVWEGDPLATAYFQAFGVDPIPLPLPDVLTSLQTGMIDTVYQSPAVLIGFQWSTKVRYMTDVPLADASGGLLLKRSVLERLPEDDRRVLLELAAKYGAEVIRATREENARARKQLLAGGIERVEFDPAERATFERRGREVSYRLAGEGRGKLFPRAMLDAMYRLLDEHRAAKAHGGGEAGSSEK